MFTSLSHDTCAYQDGLAFDGVLRHSRYTLRIRALQQGGFAVGGSLRHGL